MLDLTSHKVDRGSPDLFRLPVDARPWIVGVQPVERSERDVFGHAVAEGPAEFERMFAAAHDGIRLPFFQPLAKSRSVPSRVPVVGSLSRKACATAERIKEEELRYGNPGGSERHGDIVIVDDAGRGKVILQFPRALTGQSKRWVRVCGFTSTGDGATFWRVRTFRRGENTSLESARLCVREIASMKEAA